jgi:hypothetical protein
LRSFFSVFFFVGSIILGIFLFNILVIIFAVIFSVPALNVNSFGRLLFVGGLARFDLDHFFHRHQLILSHTDPVRFFLDKNVRRPPGVAQIYPGPRERTPTVRRVFINFVSGFHEPVLVVFSGIYPNFKFKLPTPAPNKIYTLEINKNPKAKSDALADKNQIRTLTPKNHPQIFFPVTLLTQTLSGPITDNNNAKPQTLQAIGPSNFIYRAANNSLPFRPLAARHGRGNYHHFPILQIFADPAAITFAQRKFHLRKNRKKDDAPKKPIRNPQNLNQAGA